MSTVFIAVQCFQCSTMQVKQRKKSSNKWSCVVCNERQSVRKVFSHGFMAKDVRKFVQTFNMSRQIMEEETLVQQPIENQQVLSSTKKRTDWSDYIDHDDMNDSSGTGDDQGEPNVVTELPKPLFKKPKLSNNYSAAGLDREQLHRPVFGKRNVKNKKNVNSPGNETGPVVEGNSENQYNNHDHVSVYGRSNLMMTNIERPNSKLNAGADVDRGYTGSSSSVMVKLKKPVSKWNKFIDDDAAADGWQLESGCEEINHAAFETRVSDEIVEDDVHPDFM
ncbi:hypothetical protein SSX86_029086 [Deinandra increscens subsp. villosa]|uniref:MRN complex-interacting protein N-terminal domain-containing protein n=1 Tax=Deinandra increscens subsp. villosa TaxID=3103831 RepID=A0AAP0CE60_9ASTR